MYLSRVELDSTRRETMVALDAPQKFHGAVESAFPGARCRRLWRIDRVNGRLWLLIVSEDAPDLSGIAAQFGAPGSPRCQCKDYAPLLQRIAPDSVWQFRLTANPTKSCPPENRDGSRGTVHAHCTPNHQKQWLQDRAPRHGFSLDADAFTVTHSQWFRFYKGSDRRTVSLLSVTYEGTLRVTDPELFRETLTNGIGRGKAYGLGMLTVMRGGDIGG